MCLMDIMNVLRTGMSMSISRIHVWVSYIDTAIWMHYLDANWTAGEETTRQLHKNVARNIEHVLAATPHKEPTIRPPASHHENYTS